MPRSVVPPSSFSLPLLWLSLLPTGGTWKKALSHRIQKSCWVCLKIWFNQSINQSINISIYQYIYIYLYLSYIPQVLAVLIGRMMKKLITQSEYNSVVDLGNAVFDKPTHGWRRTSLSSWPTAMSEICLVDDVDAHWALPSTIQSPRKIRKGLSRCWISMFRFPRSENDDKLYKFIVQKRKPSPPGFNFTTSSRNPSDCALPPGNLKWSTTIWLLENLYLRDF